MIMGDRDFINIITFTHNVKEDVNILNNVNEMFEYEKYMKQELIDKHFGIYKTIIIFKSDSLKFMDCIKSIKDVLINIKSVNIKEFIFEENHLYNGKNIYRNYKTVGSIHQDVLFDEYQKILNILGGIQNGYRRMRRINRKAIKCRKKNFRNFGGGELQFVQTHEHHRVYAEFK